MPMALGWGAGAELRRAAQAVAIVGGLVVSQMLTLFTTPVICLYLDRLRKGLTLRGQPSFARRPGVLVPGGLREHIRDDADHGALLLPLLVAPGAAVGPRYQRPDAEAPAAIKEMADNDLLEDGDAKRRSARRANGGGIFGDPQLNQLEELVDVSNQNLKQAEAQFRQARALVRGQPRELLPDDRHDAVDYAKRRRDK